jgi:NAD(P)H-dependent FMN reductase
MNATPGPYGGVRHLYHLRQVMSGLQTIVLPNQVQLGRADHAFDQAGKLTDERWSKALDTLAKSLVQMAGKLA